MARRTLVILLLLVPLLAWAGATKESEGSGEVKTVTLFMRELPDGVDHEDGRTPGGGSGTENTRRCVHGGEPEHKNRVY